MELKDSTIFLPKRVVYLIKNSLDEFDEYIIYQVLKDVNKPSMGTIFEFVKSE